MQPNGQVLLLDLLLQIFFILVQVACNGHAVDQTDQHRNGDHDDADRGADTGKLDTGVHF